MRPLGYDPDWYDNGPGSEAFKRKSRMLEKKALEQMSKCPTCRRPWLFGPRKKEEDKP